MAAATAFVTSAAGARVRATAWAGAAVCWPAAAAAAAARPAMTAEPYASSSPVRVAVKPPAPPPEPVSVETPKSLAVPFMKKPEGLIESQDGCTWGTAVDDGCGWDGALCVCTCWQRDAGKGVQRGGEEVRGGGSLPSGTPLGCSDADSDNL